MLLCTLLMLFVHSYGDAQNSRKRYLQSADSSGFVNLTDVVPDVILEIRYFGTYNFVGARIDGYSEPVALVTKQCAEALKKVSDYLITKGYRLKIYDAYRPQRGVEHFKRWAKDLKDTSMKRCFYPHKHKSVLFKEGYIASHSGHSRGSTLDLTIVDMKSGKEVDMGGVFDYFSEVSHTASQAITPKQRANRQILKSAMERFGFYNYKREWWHYTLRNEPYPDTYFTFENKKLR